MSSKCLCFNISDQVEYDLWSNTHLPKPKKIEPYGLTIKPCCLGCDECRDAYYQRGSREHYKLKCMEINKKRKAALDAELDQLKSERDAINKATYFEPKDEPVWDEFAREYTYCKQRTPPTYNLYRSEKELGMIPSSSRGC